MLGAVLSWHAILIVLCFRLRCHRGKRRTKSRLNSDQSNVGNSNKSMPNFFFRRSLKLRMSTVLFLGSASCDRCQKKQSGNASGNEVSSLGRPKPPLSISILEVSVSWDPFGESGSLNNSGSGETSWIPTSLSAREGKSLGVGRHEKRHGQTQCRVKDARQL